MEEKQTAENIRKKELFQSLFLIQTILDQFSLELKDYQSELNQINENIDQLIQQMIEDFEETYFE